MNVLKRLFAKSADPDVVFQFRDLTQGDGDLGSFDWNHVAALSFEIDDVDITQDLTASLCQKYDGHDVLNSLAKHLSKLEKSCRSGLNSAAQHCLANGIVVLKQLMFHVSALCSKHSDWPLSKSIQEESSNTKVPHQCWSEIANLLVGASDPDIHNERTVEVACVALVQSVSLALLSKVVLNEVSKRGREGILSLVEQCFGRLLKYECTRRLRKDALLSLYGYIHSLSIDAENGKVVAEFFSGRSGDGRLKNIIELFMLHSSRPSKNGFIQIYALAMLERFLRTNETFLNLFCTSPKFASVWRTLFRLIPSPFQGVDAQDGLLATAVLRLTSYVVRKQPSVSSKLIDVVFEGRDKDTFDLFTERKQSLGRADVVAGRANSCLTLLNGVLEDLVCSGDRRSMLYNAELSLLTLRILYGVVKSENERFYGELREVRHFLGAFLSQIFHTMEGLVDVHLRKPESWNAVEYSWSTKDATVQRHAEICRLLFPPIAWSEKATLEAASYLCNFFPTLIEKSFDSNQKQHIFRVVGSNKHAVRGFVDVLQSLGESSTKSQLVKYFQYLSELSERKSQSLL